MVDQQRLRGLQKTVCKETVEHSVLNLVECIDGNDDFIFKG